MPAGKFTFGVYEFDLVRNELRREGTLVHLQAQPKRALAYLLEHAGQTVSREELCRAIWGTGTHVDFERGLNFCISQIRTALRDDPAKPVYIRTLPKEGYCFIAPVTRSETAPIVGSDPRIDPVTPPARAAAWRHKEAIAAAIVLIAGASFLGGYRLRTAHASTKQPAILAVLRFDNETGNADMARFTDNLTDSVVEQLTTSAEGHYEVIGNATVLRAPREQRDLNAVARELHARYVVLGQVQAHSGDTRVLAHLIRLPEQTHLWVVRLDRSIGDPLAVQAEIARKIASDFAPRIAADVKNGFSSPGLTH